MPVHSPAKTGKTCAASTASFWSKKGVHDKRTMSALRKSDIQPRLLHETLNEFGAARDAHTYYPWDVFSLRGESCEYTRKQALREIVRQ